MEKKQIERNHVWTALTKSTSTKTGKPMDEDLKSVGEKSTCSAAYHDMEVSIEEKPHTSKFQMCRKLERRTNSPCEFDDIEEINLIEQRPQFNQNCNRNYNPWRENKEESMKKKASLYSLIQTTETGIKYKRKNIKFLCPKDRKDEWKDLCKTGQMPIHNNFDKVIPFTAELEESNSCLPNANGVSEKQHSEGRMRKSWRRVFKKDNKITPVDVDESGGSKATSSKSGLENNSKKDAKTKTDIFQIKSNKEICNPANGSSGENIHMKDPENSERNKWKLFWNKRWKRRENNMDGSGSANEETPSAKADPEVLDANESQSSLRTRISSSWTRWRRRNAVGPDNRN